MEESTFSAFYDREQSSIGEAGMENGSSNLLENPHHGRHFLWSHLDVGGVIPPGVAEGGAIGSNRCKRAESAMA